MANLSHLVTKKRTPVGEPVAETGYTDLGHLLQPGEETQAQLDEQQALVDSLTPRGATQTGEVIPPTAQEVAAEPQAPRLRGVAGRAISAIEEAQQTGVGYKHEVDVGQIVQDEFAAMQETWGGIPGVRYAVEAPVRAGAAFTQGLIDPILGIISLAPNFENLTVYTYRDPKTNALTSKTFENFREDLSLVRQLERARILTQDTLLGRMAMYAGDAASFVTAARPVTKLAGTIGNQIMQRTASKLLTRLGQTAAEGVGLSVVSLLSARGQAGIEGAGFDALTADDYFKYHLTMSFVFPLVGRGSNWAIGKYEEIARKQVSTGVRSAINSAALSAFGTGQLALELREGGFTTEEFKEITANLGGSFAGFEMAGAYNVFFKGPTRARTVRGLSHQLDLVRQYYEQRALGAAKIGPEKSPETLAALRRSRAREHYKTMQTRLSGEIKTTWQDLVRVFNVTKREAKKIVADGIGEKERAEIIKTRIDEGTILQIHELSRMLREQGLEPHHVAMEFMYREGLMDPVTRRTYEKMIGAWEAADQGRLTKKQAKGKYGVKGGVQGPTGPEVRGEVRSEYQAKLAAAIPTTDVVRARAKAEAKFEDQIDGVLDAEQYLKARQEQEAARREADYTAAEAQRAERQAAAREGPREEPFRMVDATPEQLAGLQRRAQEGGLTGLGQLQKRPEPAAPVGRGAPGAPGRFKATSGSQERLVGQLPGPRGPFEVTGGVEPTKGLARAGRGAPPPPSQALHAEHGPVPERMGTPGREALAREVEARRWQLPAAGERGTVNVGPHRTAHRAEVARQEFIEAAKARPQDVRVAPRKGGFFVEVARPAIETTPLIRTEGLETSMPGFYVSGHRRLPTQVGVGGVRAEFPPQPEPTPQGWKVAEGRREFVKRNPRQVTWEDVAAGLVEVEKWPATDFYRGEHAPPPPVRAAEIAARAREILGDKAVSGLIDVAALSRQPIDPRGVLVREYKGRPQAERAMAAIKKLAENEGIEFYVDSMMIDPATGKDVGPWKVVPRETRVKSTWEVFNKEGLPKELKGALEQGERDVMAELVEREGFVEQTRKFFEQYPEIGKMGILALGMTSAGIAQLQAEEDTLGSVAVGLAGLPFFMFSKKRGGKSPMLPFEVARNAAIRKAQDQVSRARLMREYAAEVENMASTKKLSPRAVDRFADAVDKDIDPGLGGGMRAKSTQVETLDGQTTMSYSEIRRGEWDGELLRPIGDARPSGFERWLAGKRTEQTGLGDKAALFSPFTTGLGLMRAGVGEALSMYGPGGQVIAVTANEATWNVRSRLQTLWTGLAVQPWESRVDLMREMNLAEREVLNGLMEKPFEQLRPRVRTKLEEKIAKLTPQNHERIEAIAEIANRMIKGRKGEFVDPAAKPELTRDIERYIDYVDRMAAIVWKEAQELGLVGAEDIGFLNPSGSYWPVLLRGEVFEPQARSTLGAGITVGAVGGAVLGALVSDEQPIAGALAGAAAGAGLGFGASNAMWNRRSAAAKQYQELIEQDMTSRGVQTSDGKGGTRAALGSEIRHVLEGYKESRFQGMYAIPTNTHQTTNRKARFLEKSRLLDTHVGREWDPSVAFGRYFEGAIRRVEMARMFGNKYQRANNIFEAMQGAGWNTDPARDLFDVITGSSRWVTEGKSSEMLDQFGAVAVPVKLSLAGIAQTGSWAKTVAHTGVREWKRNWFKSFQDMVVSDQVGWFRNIPIERRRKMMDVQSRVLVAETGALMESEFALYFGNLGRSFLSNAGGAFLNYNGVLPFDRVGRYQAALAGRDYFSRIRQVYESNLRAGEDAQAAREKSAPLFRELFVDPLPVTEGLLFRRGKTNPARLLQEQWVEMALKPVLTAEETALLTNYAGAQTVKRASGRTEVIDMPASAQHPLFKHMMTLNSFNFRMQAEFYQHVRRIGRLARQGKKAEAVKMLMKMSATLPLAYYGPRKVRSFLQGRDDDWPWFDRWLDAAGYAGWFNVEAGIWNEYYRQLYGIRSAMGILSRQAVVAEQLFELTDAGLHLGRTNENTALKLWLAEAAGPAAKRPMKSRIKSLGRKVGREEKRRD